MTGKAFSRVKIEAPLEDHVWAVHDATSVQFEYHLRLHTAANNKISLGPSQL
jgi:hypothetical protein